jgi:drug/metabolite transporter (DMT)-like permease
LYIAMVVALCVAAGAAIVVVLSGESSDTAVRIAYTASSLLLFGLPAVAGMTLLNGSRLRWLGWLCVTAALAGFVVFTVASWSTAQDDEVGIGLLKAMGSLFVTSFALAHVSLLAERNVDTEDRLGTVLIVATQAAALGLAGLLTIAILEEISDDTYYRWLGAVAVLWVLGTVLVPIVRKLRQSV